MLKLIYKIIDITKNFLIKFCKMNVNKLDNIDNDSSFNSLMPKENIDISNYREALDYIFSSKDVIKNIAILGAYGSGKSSIVNTYEKQHPEHNFIHVSLAHFNNNLENSKDSKGDRCVNLSENSISYLLEGKILNQLIHQIKVSNIKDTNFNIKRSLPWYQKLFYSFAMFFIILSIFYVTLYSKWNSWIISNNYEFLTFTLSDIFQLVVFSGCILILAVLIFCFVSRSGHFKRLKKLGIKSVVDIEVFDSSNESSFDKYLNEVIYLFQNSKADVIVFEDLDRYDSVAIFEKLREINYLINNKSTNKTIRFLYLIRDDIFNSVERSKFFDFIIPIVPVIDITNSSDKFSKLLEDANCMEGLDKHFIYDLAYYINDMRLLYNIVNEFQIYRKIINPKQNTNYNANYQLAIIVYKNLFPEDFHALQSGRGYVYDIFKSKNDLCDILKADYIKRKSELSDELKLFEEQKIHNIDELNALYFPIVNGDVRIANETIPQDISRVDLVKKIIHTKNSVTVLKNGYTLQITVKDMVKKMEDNPEYNSKREIIELYSRENLKNISDKIESYTKEINIISTKRLKALINDAGADEFWENFNKKYKDIENELHHITLDRNFPVIKYLITNGLLNEDYNLYSSYIYSDELTPADRGFILSVNEGKQNPYTYKLDNPQKVVEHINPAVFLLSNIHNFDLLEYVLKNKKDDIIINWFNTIDAYGNNGYRFIIEFIMMHIEESDMLSYIVMHRPKWLHVWYSERLINEVDFRKILFAIIDACPVNALENINEAMWLTKKISNDSSYLVIDTTNISKYCQALNSLGVIFSNIVANERTKEVLDFVYKNNMYEINTGNIVEIVSIYTKFNINKDVVRFCSYVYKNIEKPICKYLLSDCNNLIEFVLSYSKRKFNDEQNVILNILNNEKVTSENKMAYMEKSSVKIINISNVTELTLWPDLLTIKAFQPTWRNYLTYFCKIEISDESISNELIICMTSAKNSKVLAFKNLRDYIGEENASEFLKKLVYTKFSDHSDYRRILKQIGFIFNSFTYKSLENWQITSLLELNCISRTKENYNFFKQNYAKNTQDFLFLGNSKSAFKLLKDKEITLESSEILNLLSDVRIDDEQSKILLNLYGGNISLENKKYSDEVCCEIIKNHFNVEDLPWILKRYQSFGAKTKEIVLDYAKQNSSRIISIVTAQKCLPIRIYSMFISESVCTKDVLKTLLDALSDTRYKDLCKHGKSPSFENLEYNVVILNYFKEEGWISSYSELNGKLRGYPKRKVS